MMDELLWEIVLRSDKYCQLHTGQGVFVEVKMAK